MGANAHRPRSLSIYNRLGLPVIDYTPPIEYIKGHASIGPVAVITDAGWGTPADAAWVYLAGNPNVHLFYTLHPDPILVPAGPADTFFLRRDKWLFTKEEPIILPDVPVLSDQ